MAACPSSSTISRSRRWLCLLALVLAAATAQAQAQLTSVLDADGNTVVLSVGTDINGDATTSAVETLDPATAATTTAGGVAAVPAAAAATTSSSSVISQNLGQVGLGDAGSSSSTSTAPPTTYLVYYTVNGVQTSGYSTFTASFQTTPPPIAPSKGTVLAYTEYITSAPSSSKSSGAGESDKLKLSTRNGQVAALGLALSLVLGAVMVF